MYFGSRTRVSLSWFIYFVGITTIILAINNSSNTNAADNCFSLTCGLDEYCDTTERRCSRCSKTVCELQPPVADCKRFCDGIYNYMYNRGPTIKMAQFPSDTCGLNEFYDHIEQRCSRCSEKVCELQPPVPGCKSLCEDRTAKTSDGCAGTVSPETWTHVVYGLAIGIFLLAICGLIYYIIRLKARGNQQSRTDEERDLMPNSPAREMTCITETVTEKVTFANGTRPQNQAEGEEETSVKYVHEDDDDQVHGQPSGRKQPDEQHIG